MRLLPLAPSFSLVFMSVLLFSALMACRPDAKPSADFEKASRLWLAVTLDAIASPGSDPRAEEALALARAVPAVSIDADAAKSLIRQIEQARNEESEAAAWRKTALEQAPTSLAAARTRDGDERDEAEGGELPSLEVGMSESDFKTRFGDCMRVESEFVEARGTRKGQAFAFVESAECRDMHPQVGTDLVFVLEGRVFNIAPRSATVPVVETGDGWVPESGQWPSSASTSENGDEVVQEDSLPL